VTPDASIQEIQQAADILAEKTYEDACVASVVQSAQAESGYALKVKRAPYLNKMRSKRTLFQQADESLIEMAALMMEVGLTGTPATLNEEFNVTTSYDDSRLTPEDPASQKEQEAFDLDQQVMSRIDLIQKRNGVSRDEAIEIANRIDEDNGGSSTNAALNELTLGAQRLGSVGDIEGFNAMRQEALKQIGAEEVPPAEELTRPAPDKEE
jgi:hypothetical protein